MICKGCHIAKNKRQKNKGGKVVFETPSNPILEKIWSTGQVALIQVDSNCLLVVSINRKYLCHVYMKQ